MTPDEIDELQAGPETDALVAEKVMGWHICDQRKGGHFEDPPIRTEFMIWDDGTTDIYRQEGQYGNDPEQWLPSTDISAAMEVEEAIVAKRLCGSYVLRLRDTCGCMLPVRISSDPNDFNDLGKLFCMVNASPLERCKAALKAVEAE